MNQFIKPPYETVTRLKYEKRKNNPVNLANVNGIEKNSKAQTGILGSTATAMRVGTYNTNAYMFHGDMGNIKIFNRALTAEEIKIEYNTMFNNEVQIHESGKVFAKDLRQY